MVTVRKALRGVLLLIAGLAAFLVADMALGVIASLAFGDAAHLSVPAIIVGGCLFLGLLVGTYFLIGRFVFRRF